MASAQSHRRLLREFVVREVKSRFAGSMAGLIWTLMNPLATIVVYLFIFSIVLRVQVTVAETGTGHFAIFFLAGLFPWLQFSEGLSRSVGCLVDNANLITKVVFPVELLPMGMVLSAFFINGVGMLVFILYLMFQGYIHWTMLLMLILLPVQMLFTWGLAYLTAAACVFVRDVRELLGILLMIWFFATPIIYPYSLVPDAFKVIMDLNPMSLFVSIYRQALLSHEISWMMIARVGILSLISYGLGVWFFMRAKPAFGDVL
jgi:lipopolysaccharide transport system permease protein